MGQPAAEKAGSAGPTRRQKHAVSYAFPRVTQKFLDMLNTCFHVNHMTIMVQIRNVPDSLHRRLKSRAALAGMSLSDYLLNELRQVAERPTLDELQARLRGRMETTLSVTPADAVRTERDHA